MQQGLSRRTAPSSDSWERGVDKDSNIYPTRINTTSVQSELPFVCV